jgi:hypothetical protein
MVDLLSVFDTFSTFERRFSRSRRIEVSSATIGASFLSRSGPTTFSTIPATLLFVGRWAMSSVLAAKLFSTRRVSELIFASSVLGLLIPRQCTMVHTMRQDGAECCSARPSAFRQEWRAILRGARSALEAAWTCGERPRRCVPRLAKCELPVHSAPIPGTEPATSAANQCRSGLSMRCVVGTQPNVGTFRTLASPRHCAPVTLGHVLSDQGRSSRRRKCAARFRPGIRCHRH